MFRSRTDGGCRGVAAALVMTSLLAGCSSDIYFDRRDTIGFGAGDAVAANAAEQTVDPWPRHSNNNNLTFNGQRMQHAVECYRYGAVSPPADIDPNIDTATIVPPPQPPSCDAVISTRNNNNQANTNQSNGSQSGAGGALGALMNAANK
jgi:hypothetical protein